MESQTATLEHEEGQNRESLSEGFVAKAIEHQTAKPPSDTFLWAALGSMVGSAVLYLAGKRHESIFVGQWAPTLLLFGVYNKIVKVAGSDRNENGGCCE